MKALILVITLTICTTSLSATNHNQNQRKQDNKTAISKSDNFKPIAMRTLFLECKALTDQKLTYRAFLMNPYLLKLHSDYSIEVQNRRFKAFKNFGDTYILAGESKEVKRLLNK